MSTVRFRLDNEQLPLSTAAPTYQTQYTGTETQPERFGVGEHSGTSGRNAYTKISTEFGKKVESFGPSSVPLLQQDIKTSTDFSSPIHQHTSRGTTEEFIPKMDGTLLHHSSSRIHQTSDYKPVQHELSNGRVDRPSGRPVERQWPSGQEYGQLGSLSPGGTLLSDAPDTDLCLSMVNETRPSYQMKTSGKYPLTPPHLVALFKSSEIPTTFSQSKPLTPAADKDVVSYKTSYSQLNENSTYLVSAPPGPQAVHAKPVYSSLGSKIGDAPTSNRYTSSSTYSSSYNKPPSSHIYREFDPDDILKDVKTGGAAGTGGYTSVPMSQNGAPSYSSSKVTTGHYYQQQHRQPLSTSPTGYPYVSPNAKGLAPPPTDQPVRNPARHGIEANVDAMTIRMLRNMETGYGAAGEHNCAKCGEGIFSNRPGCLAMQKTYHIECFTCCVCNTQLSGSPFYTVDDKHYCERDYIDTLDKCVTCHKPIKDRILRASGKAYHPQCFVCISCYRELDGIPFTVDSNNSNYCVQCFHEKFAPRCAVCHKPIAPEEGKKEITRVVAMDRSYHVECYKCEDCNMQLSSAVEGHGCYPLDHHLLCKNCNTARIRKITS